MVKHMQLEKAAADFAKATSTPPFLYQMPPDEGRKTVVEVQSSPVFKHPAQITDTKTDLGKLGSINVRILKPETAGKHPSVIYYIHGAGWVFGDAHTHDKLVREMAHRTGSIVVFPEYDRSPEARYPHAIEQNYAVLCMLPDMAKKHGWDISTLTVSGDSVGGNMATVMTIMAKQRGGPKIHKQLLYYPVTDCDFETESYNDFAENYFLYKDAMKWFWDQYISDSSQRSQITASPLRATLKDLQGLPPAMILNGECDVLRDEGEAYGRKLREAGVEVTALRFQAMIHDFVMLNALDQTCACRAAMDVSMEWVNKKNKKN